MENGNGPQKSILRAGFEDDFTIFYAERVTKTAPQQDDTEEVVWSDAPVTSRQTFRINTTVLLTALTLGVSLIAAVK